MHHSLYGWSTCQPPRRLSDPRLRRHLFHPNIMNLDVIRDHSAMKNAAAFMLANRDRHIYVVVQFVADVPLWEAWMATNNIEGRVVTSGKAATGWSDHEENTALCTTFFVESRPVADQLGHRLRGKDVNVLIQRATPVAPTQFISLSFFQFVWALLVTLGALVLPLPPNRVLLLVCMVYIVTLPLLPLVYRDLRQRARRKGVEMP